MRRRSALLIAFAGVVASAVARPVAAQDLNVDGRCVLRNTVFAIPFRCPLGWSAREDGSWGDIGNDTSFRAPNRNYGQQALHPPSAEIPALWLQVVEDGVPVQLPTGAVSLGGDADYYLTNLRGRWEHAATLVSAPLSMSAMRTLDLASGRWRLFTVDITSRPLLAEMAPRLGDMIDVRRVTHRGTYADGTPSGLEVMPESLAVYDGATLWIASTNLRTAYMTVVLALPRGAPAGALFERLLASVELPPAALSVRAPAGAQVLVDGRPAGTVAPNGELVSSPPLGLRRIRVEAAGFDPADTEIVVRGGDSAKFSPKLVSSGTTPAVSRYERVRQMADALARDPSDDSLRVQLFDLVQALDPKPATPPEVLESEGAGEYAYRNAHSRAEFDAAAAQYDKAILAAPWLAADYFNRGAAEESAGRPDAAIRDFQLYLRAAPDAPDATDVRRRIGGLRFAADQAIKTSIASADSARAARARDAAVQRERDERAGMDDLWRGVQGKQYQRSDCRPADRGCDWAEYQGTNWYATRVTCSFEKRYDGVYAMCASSDPSIPAATVLRVSGAAATPRGLVWEWWDLESSTFRPVHFLRMADDWSWIIFSTGAPSDPATNPKQKFWYTGLRLR